MCPAHMMSSQGEREKCVDLRIIPKETKGGPQLSESQDGLIGCC